MVEFRSVVSLSLGRVPSIWTSCGWRLWGPCAWPRVVPFWLVLARFKLPFVGIVNGAMLPFGDQGSVDHGLKIRKLQDAELGLDGLVHSMEKPVLLLLVCVDIIWGITGKIIELG